MTVTYLPDARIRRVRENLQTAQNDLAWLALQPGASDWYALAAFRISDAEDHLDRAEGKEKA